MLCSCAQDMHSSKVQGPRASCEKAAAAKAKAAPAPSRLKGYRPPAAKAGVTYSVGDSVYHKLFGKGLILSAEKMGNDTLLEIAFDKVGTKKLMANFCKMEKL